MENVYTGHTASVNALASIPVPGGAGFLSASSDKTLRLWDLGAHECLHRYTGHEKAVNTVAVTPGGRFLSGGDDYTVRLWDPLSGECLRVIENGYLAVTCLAVSPCGTRFATGHRDGSLKLWNLQTGACLKTFENHPAYDRMDDLNRLMRSNNSEFAYHDYNVDLGIGQTFDRENFRFFGHADMVHAIAFGPGGKTLVSAGRDHTLRLWDVAKGECLWIYGGYRGNFTIDARAVVFSPRYRRIYSGWSTVRVWRFSSRRFGRYRWGILGERCKRTFPRQDEGLQAMDLSMDGKFLITAGSWKPTLRLYKARSGRCLKTIPGTGAPLRDVIFAGPPGNLRALTAHEDGSIKRWELFS